MALRSILRWAFRHHCFLFKRHPTLAVPPLDSFYLSYGLRLELARTSTPHFLCPRQNQTAPISSLLQLPRARPQLGNACPFCWGLEALAKGLGVARRPSLPPVSSLRPRLTEEDRQGSVEASQSCPRPWSLQGQAISCLQGELKTLRMEASGQTPWESGWAQTSAPGVSPVSAFLF